jgi:hypothetical protein
VVLAFTKLYGVVFLGSPRSHHVAACTEVDNSRIVAMCIPAAFILIIGLAPQYVILPISHVAAAVTSGDNTIAIVNSNIAIEHFAPTLESLSYVGIGFVVVASLLYVLKRRAQRNRVVSEGPTWGCGFTSPNIRMQYTGESFSEGLQSIATSLTQNTVEGRAVGKGEIFPSSHNYNVRHKDKIDRLLAEWWVELLRIINKRMMNLRTGRINNYILFALLFLIAIVILSLFNLI